MVRKEFLFMAKRVKNTIQLIEKSIEHIDNRFDMSAENIIDISNKSKNSYELVCNGFRFGYMQGMKAAKAQMKKAGVVNGR